MILINKPISNISIFIKYPGTKITCYSDTIKAEVSTGLPLLTVLVGLADAAELWQQSYEHRPPQDFESDLDKLWETVKPLYEQLHGYIRFMLKNSIYKNFTNFFPATGHIPIHILGERIYCRWIRFRWSSR